MSGAAAAGGALVIVERSFPEAPSDEVLAAVGERMAGCMHLHGVEHLNGWLDLERAMLETTTAMTQVRRRPRLRWRMRMSSIAPTYTPLQRQTVESGFRRSRKWGAASGTAAAGSGSDIRLKVWLVAG